MRHVRAGTRSRRLRWQSEGDGGERKGGCDATQRGLSEAIYICHSWEFGLFPVAGGQTRGQPLPMIDVIKKTLLAGVGAAIVTKEKAEAALNEFVRQGKLSSGDAKIMAEKIAEQGRREFEEVSETLGAKIKALLDRSETDTAVRLKALEERVLVLETKLTPPPSRAGEP